VREKAKRAAEEVEMERYSFHPNINQEAVSALVDMSNHKPIHERVSQIQRERNEALQRLRLKKEQDPDCTFQPKVSDASRALVKARRERDGGAEEEKEDIVTRLGKEKKRTVERRANLHEAHTKEERAELTFEPAISDNTQKILSQNKMFKVGFLARQEAYSRASKERKQAAQVEYDEELTFNPDIGNADEILEKKHDPRVKESFLERVERLSLKDAERKRAMNAQIEEEYYSQFTFRPEIDGHSKKLGRAATSEELYRNEKMRASKARLKAGAEKAFEEECTFQPMLGPSAKFDPAKLNKYRLNLEDPEGLTERIEEHRREREQRAEEARKEKDYEALKECTFQPNVSISKREEEDADGPVIVRGLGRHLELKEMAKKKEEERLAREEEIFKTNPREAKGGYTVPQPFNLSDNLKAKAKAEKIRQNIIAEREKECTFMPKTNLSNRDLIRQIMNDEITYT